MIPEICGTRRKRSHAWRHFGQYPARDPTPSWIGRRSEFIQAPSHRRRAAIMAITMTCRFSGYAPSDQRGLPNTVKSWENTTLCRIDTAPNPGDHAVPVLGSTFHSHLIGCCLSTNKSTLKGSPRPSRTCERSACRPVCLACSRLDPGVARRQDACAASPTSPPIASQNNPA